MPPNNNNPYDFFLSQPPQPSHPPIISGGGLKQRLLVVGGATFILIIILVVLFGVILKPKTGGIEAMYQVAATQQDIIELIETGNKEVRDQQLLDTAASVSAVVNSHYYETKISISKSSNTKTSTAKIDALRDTKFKKALEDAKTNGTYDDSFLAILSNRLDMYRTNLQSAYTQASAQKLKNQLSEEYNQINELTPKES